MLVNLILLSVLISCSVPTSSFATGLTTPSTSKLNTFGFKQKMQAPGIHRRPIEESSLYTTGSETIASQERKGGEATISTSIFNLAKSIIGAGVLSLPSGVAFFADEPSALLPASVICGVFGLMAAYSFSSIGNICKEYDADSFQDAWAKSVSPKSAWVISSSITAMCFLASLAYSIIIGDSFTALARTFNLSGLIASRSNVILVLTTLVLLPLCALKSLNSLAPFSLLGLGGTLYTAIFMVIRFLDKSYAAGGNFFTQIPFKPSFNARGGYALNHLTFVLLSMLSTSYIAHYNAPKFFTELKNPTMPRFNQVVSGAFGASILFFVLIMCTGFLTFGGATQGFILNNYASNDVLATFARFAIGVALVTGYPFTFSALREGLLDIAQVKGEGRDKLFKPLTFGLLGLVTSLALVLKDVGFVVSISGALFGCALMFIVPAVMNVKNLDRLQAAGKKGKNDGLEKGFNFLLMITGLIMGVLGVFVSTMRQMGKM